MTTEIKSRSPEYSLTSFAAGKGRVSLQITLSNGDFIQLSRDAIASLVFDLTDYLTPVGDHKERVRAEYAQLSGSAMRLHDFIHSGKAELSQFDLLPPWEKDLLVAQLAAMRAYAAILEKRLANWLYQECAK